MDSSSLASVCLYQVFLQELHHLSDGNEKVRKQIGLILLNVIDILDGAIDTRSLFNSSYSEQSYSCSLSGDQPRSVAGRSTELLH